MIKSWVLIFLTLTLVILPVVGCTKNTTLTTARGNLQIQVKEMSQSTLWGAKVVSETQPEGQLKVTGLTDNNGMVVFNDIIAGDYRFYVNRFDYFQTEVALTVIAGQTQSIVVNLTPVETSIPNTSTPPITITFADLISQPQQYTDKCIVIDGYWFDGFEIEVLAERLDPSSFAAGNLQPGGVMIWIMGGLSEEVSVQLYLQPNNPTGYPAHYGKVEVIGKLEYGGKYGHMNAYQYQLRVYESRLLPWTLPTI